MKQIGNPGQSNRSASQPQAGGDARAARSATAVAAVQNGASASLRSCAAWLAVISLLLSLCGPAVRAQPRIRNRQGNPEQNATSVFLPIPRELRREFAKAEEAIAEKRFSDAILQLELILNNSQDLGIESEDFFLDNEGELAARSIRREIDRLIGGLPEAGRQLYELKFGAEARHRVQEAAQRGDAIELAEVSRTFFHTEAGQVATLLLGRIFLQQGRPLAAALPFQRLFQEAGASSETRAAIHREAGLLLAFCWRLAGDNDKALDILRAVRDADPAARFRISGHEVPIFARSEDAPAWLDEHLQVLAQSLNIRPTNWLMHRGSPDRNASVNADMPLIRGHQKDWEQPPRTDAPNAPHTDEATIRELYNTVAAENFLPTMQPLVVNDVVLMRYIDGLLGINLTTGKMSWEFPYGDPLTKQVRKNSGVNGRATERDFLRQRVWEDNLFGQMSSDGRAVFLLDELDIDPQALFANRQFNPAGGLNMPGVSNVMVALELETEGKYLWRIGGASGDQESKLAGAYFLGPPVAVNGQLFALAEIRGELRLVVLAAATGKLLWSQQVGHVDQLVIGFDRLRQVAGASPSYSDGIVVCPTSAGAIVAVDVLNRSLLWGFQYGRATGNDNNMARNVWRGNRMTWQPTGNRWHDATVTIADGKVVATPLESGDKIYCLDLLTGKQAWPAKSRDGHLFVAGVYEGQIILVGAQKIEAWDLQTGQTTWKLPLSSAPSGRGVLAAPYYLLATSAAQLIKIDLRSGKVTDTIETDEPLGNLVASHDYLLAQNHRRLVCFFQADKLQDRVQQRLAQNPDDVWALEHDADLKLKSGQIELAIASLQKALSLQQAAPDGQDSLELRVATIRGSLLEAVLEVLRQNRPGADQWISLAESLIDSATQQEELLRLIANNQLSRKQYLASVKNYLRLFALSQSAGYADYGAEELLAVGNAYRVSQDAMLQGVFDQVWQEAPADDRRQIAELVADQLLATTSDSATRRRLLHIVGRLPEFQSQLLEWTSQQFADEPSFKAEAIFASLREAGRTEVAGPATARLATIYRRAGRWEEASVLYAELAGRFASVPCDKEKTGAQLGQEFLQDWSAETAQQDGAMVMPHAVSWNYGRVAVSRSENANPARATLNRNIYARQNLGSSESIAVPNRAGLLPAGSFLVVDQSAPGLTVRDGRGAILASAQLQQLGTLEDFRAIAEVGSVGHLVVLQSGPKLFAINTLQRQDPTTQVVWDRSIQAELSADIARRFSQTSEPVIWNLTKNRAYDGESQTVLSQLGPVTSQGVVFRRWRELTCLDPATGTPIWERQGISSDAEIWGDDQIVLVADSDKTFARMFRITDGEEIGKPYVPDARRRIAFLGRQVLIWSPELASGNTKYELRLYDPVTRQDVWSAQFSAEAQAEFVNETELAILEKSGRFVLLDLSTGEIRIDRPLIEPGTGELLMYVQSARKSLVVTVGRQAKNMTDTHRITRIASGGELLDSTVHCFDSHTGEALWALPARVNGYAPLPQVPAELPILVFGRQLVDKKNPSQPAVSFLVLDRRDGRLILEAEDRQQGNSFEFQGDLQKQEMQISAPIRNGSFTLQLTDEPRPPEPAYGYQTTREPSQFTESIKKLIRLPWQILEGIANPADGLEDVEK